MVDPHQFNDPKNLKLIQTDVDRLLRLSTQAEHSTVLQKKDPTMKFISEAFVDDLGRAKESIAADKLDFARYTLLNISAYCIECHTRTSSGPSFSTANLEKALKKLDPMEKAEYLYATRSFDAAEDALSRIIKHSLEDAGNVFLLEKSIRYSLSIAVRYYQSNNKRALEIVHLLTKSAKTPLFLKQSSIIWEKSILRWQHEKRKKHETVTEKLKHCEELIKQAEENKSQAGERAGDIEYLRVLGTLQQVDSTVLSPDQLGELLYLTGISDDNMKDLSIWSLHDSYYETCIRQVPHSAWAKKCFNRLEESMNFGYTGSSGLNLPADVQQKLDELKKMSQPAP